MKYIVTQDERGFEEIFLFPDTVNHDCMAEGLEGLKNQSHGNWRRVRRGVVSAGFVVGGKCGGRSESLKLDSRPEQDTKLLMMTTGREG